MTTPPLDPAAPRASEPKPARRWLRWLLGLLALAAILRVVPLRDRCATPEAPGVRFAVSREGPRCTRHDGGAARPLPPAACARLRCEPGVISTVRRTHVGHLAALAALYLLASVTWALRWRALLPLAGLRLPVWPVWRVSLESMAAAALIPTSISADAVRVVAMTARGAPASKVIATILLDRMIGLGALLAVAFSLVAASGGAPAGWRVALGGALAAVALAVAVLSRGWLLRIRWLLETRPGRAVSPALEAASAPGAGGALTRALLWAFAVAAINFGVIRALVAELGATPRSEAEFYLRVALIFVATLLPGVPGSWEAAWVFLLSGAGVAPSASLGACFILRLYTYLLAACGAASMAWSGRPPPPAETLVPPGASR